MGKKIAIVGAIFAGLASAKVLTEFGYNVHVYEKDSDVGMSPTEYLRDGRLNRVRDDLLSDRTLHSSVSDIAFSWGFTHLGRFAKTYYERFGELPSKTLRR